MNSDRAAAAGAAIERPRSVFDRLRDGVSRSHSRSGKNSSKSKSPAPSRPVSRAASGILAKDESLAELAPVTAANPAPAPAPAPAPTSAHGHSHAQMDLGAMPEPFAAGLASPLPEDGERRREAWEGEDAEVGDARWRVEGDRLGVLPSPSVMESPVRSGSESEGGARKGSWIGGVVVPEVVVEVRGKEGEGEDPGTGVGGRNAEEREGQAGPMAVHGADRVVGAGGDTAVMPAQISERQVGLPPSTSAEGTKEALVERETKTSPTPMEPQGNTAPLPRPVQTRSASYAAPSSAAATRPQPERKFSALDELPSQQRRRQFTPAATPRRLSLAEDGTMAAKPALGARPESTVDDDKPKISRPPTPAKWDLLSTVAASAPPAQATASRRSSISSLGDPRSLDNVMASEEKRRSVVGFPTVIDAVDDGRRSVSPLPAQEEPLDLAGAPRGNNFMNRTYMSGRATDQRPMSYMPLSSETPGQEAMGMPQQQQKRFSTPGDFAGYSVPGMVEGPQEQRIPSGPPSRTPSIGLPPKEYDRLRSPQPGDEEPFPGDTSSRQSSGFFRGAGQPAAIGEPSSRRSSFFRGPDLLPAPGPGMIPSPSRVDENFNGLVDPQVSEFSDDIVRSEQQEQPQKQSRRKSGIMDTFRRASTHSMTASRPSSRGSMAKIAATNGNEGTMAKSKTLKKPQRAPSSAVEPKNKRLSRLGSLFRRSSSAKNERAGDRASKALAAGPEVEAQPVSTGTAAPRKLTKAAPPPRQPSQPQPYYTAPPRPGNYAAYEAMMRQQAGQHLPPQYWQQPAYSEPAMVSSPYQQQVPAGAYNQQQPSGYYQQGPPVGLQQQYPASASSSRTHSLVGNQSGYQNQPVEYYSTPQSQSPAAYPLPSSQPASPMQGQARPQVRRLHSENHRRRDTVPDIPEVNSPVLPSAEEPDATRFSPGYGQLEQTQRPIAQEQMIHNGQTGPSRPTMNARQSPNYSQSSVVRSSVGVQPLENLSRAPGPQDGRPQDWQQPPKAQRISPPASPVQTQRMPQQQYTGSIDQQIARSPARDQQGQQTPWAISLPQGQDSSYRSHEASSWEMQPPSRSPQQYYSGPPAAARGAVRSSSPPQQYHDQYSHMTPYHFVPPLQQAQRPALHTQQRSSSYGFEQAASPTYYAPQDRGYTYGPQQHYPQQQRYYGHHRQTSRDSQGRPVAQHQRTASSYSGRRDDTGVSEAEIMRGVSYPGQEWTPGRI